MGYPSLSRPGKGYPLSGKMGVLPVRKDGVPSVGKDGVPPIRKDGDTHHQPDGGTPCKCEQTDARENITFLILLECGR